MATKTFKIGESCEGGIITVQTGVNKVTVIQKQWDYSQGTRKSSNQKNAEEIDRIEVSTTEGAEGLRRIERSLQEITTDYYTYKVLGYIQAKVTFKKKNTW